MVLSCLIHFVAGIPAFTKVEYSKDVYCLSAATALQGTANAGQSPKSSSAQGSQAPDGLQASSASGPLLRRVGTAAVQNKPFLQKLAASQVQPRTAAAPTWSQTTASTQQPKVAAQPKVAVQSLTAPLPAKAPDIPPQGTIHAGVTQGGVSKTPDASQKGVKQKRVPSTGVSKSGLLPAAQSADGKAPAPVPQETARPSFACKCRFNSCGSTVSVPPTCL